MAPSEHLAYRGEADREKVSFEERRELFVPALAEAQKAEYVRVD
jgi:hypothetical protein